MCILYLYARAHISISVRCSYTYSTSVCSVYVIILKTLPGDQSVQTEAHCVQKKGSLDENDLCGGLMRDNKSKHHPYTACMSRLHTAKISSCQSSHLHLQGYAFSPSNIRLLAWEPASFTYDAHQMHEHGVWQTEASPKHLGWPRGWVIELFFRP